MNAVGPVSTRAEDGWLLSGEVLAPSSGRGVVLLLHAMMVNRKTMDRPRGAGLATMLGRMGLGVVVFDLRGHGESGPSARDGARFTYDDYVLFDLPALISWARAAFPGERLTVVGHSLGGHAALASAGVFPESAADKIVSLAGNMWRPSWEPHAGRRLAKAALLRSWLLVTERWGYFDPKPLRFGTEAVALPYVRQFWEIWSKDHYGSLCGRYDYQEALGRVRLPLLSVASEGDPMLANPEAVGRFVAGVGSTKKVIRVVRHAESGGQAPSHMGLVTRASSSPVWEEIGRWVIGA